MRFYYFLLCVTFILSFYAWINDNYLYKEFYVKYLPNYNKEVAFPLYDISGKRVGGDPEIRDNIMSYIPLYGKIIYYTQVPVIMINALLLPITLIFGIIVFLRGEKYLHIPWSALQILIFYLMFFFIRHTEVMD